MKTPCWWLLLSYLYINCSRLFFFILLVSFQVDSAKAEYIRCNLVFCLFWVGASFPPSGWGLVLCIVIWQIPVLWLVLSRSGFCRTLRFRVSLFWSEAAKFKIYNQNSEKILSFFALKLLEEAKKIEFFSEISNMDEEDEHFEVQATRSAFYYQKQSAI